MKVVATPSTESVVSELPSLLSTDHDNNVMIEKEGEAINNNDSSQIISSLNDGSFDHWHKEHPWDDVVIIMGNDDESACHVIGMEEVLAEKADDKHPSQSLLDSAMGMMVEANNAAPFMDEFLVGDNENHKLGTDADDLNQYSRDFQVPRSKKVASRGEFGKTMHPASKYDMIGHGTASFKTVKTLTPNKHYSTGSENEFYSYFVRAPSYTNLDLPSLSPPTKRSTCSASFKEMYRKRLQRLRESMYQSCKSRGSLRMSCSPRVTGKYSRQTNVSQVLYSIESSSRRIDACYLDPVFLNRGMQSPQPKSKLTTQLQRKTESAAVSTTKGAYTRNEKLPLISSA
jgi:hypothetical protein